MSFETSRTISADHPSLAGHFPGAPIVPGVVILDEVAAVLAGWCKDCEITGIPAVKFLLPLQPGQAFTISLKRSQGMSTQVNFRCRVEERTVAKGRFTIALADI